MGAVIVAGPLVRYPEVTDLLLAGINPDVPAAVPISARASVLWVGVACGLLGALLAMREGDRTTAVEVVMLVTLPLIVPPLTAFAVFFGAWHAPRHTLRLLAEDPRNTADLRAGRLARPLRRFLVSSAPTTALAALGVASLAAAVAAGGAPALAIAALLALTVPHAVAVGWLDVRVARTLGRVPRPTYTTDAGTTRR